MQERRSRIWHDGPMATSDRAPDQDPPRTPRERSRDETMARVLDLGARQLDRKGPEALSVRELARDLGMVSSAVYRYVSSRDELLTLLLVASYDDLAQSVDDALAEMRPRGGSKEAFERLARAVRAWALHHPSQWTLLYGTPVRGYAAPRDRTVGPGTRVLARLLEIVETSPSPVLRRDLGLGVREVLDAGAADLGSNASAEAVVSASVLWSATVGAISAEIFEQWGPGFSMHGDALFTAQLELIGRTLGDGTPRRV